MEEDRGREKSRTHSREQGKIQLIVRSLTFYVTSHSQTLNLNVQRIKIHVIFYLKIISTLVIISQSPESYLRMSRPQTSLRGLAPRRGWRLWAVFSGRGARTPRWTALRCGCQYATCWDEALSAWRSRWHVKSHCFVIYLKILKWSFNINHCLDQQK